MIAETISGVCRLVAGAAAEWQCEADAAQPRVFYANHASHLDFVMIWSALPRGSRLEVRPVARMEYWNAGPARRFVAGHVFRAVLIERSPGAVPTMAAELDRRHSLILFPEGTRSPDGAVGDFKSGLYHLSRLRPNVDLVPVFVANTGRILPKGEALPVPMTSRVVFGAPLRADACETRDAFLRRARAALVQLGGSHVSTM
jgi:1-acyl-sn-glycerol-3-phosphate acyltransferase